LNIFNFVLKENSLEREKKGSKFDQNKIQSIKKKLKEKLTKF
jgi:hypothetical protein